MMIISLDVLIAIIQLTLLLQKKQSQWHVLYIMASWRASAVICSKIFWYQFLAAQGNQRRQKKISPFNPIVIVQCVKPNNQEQTLSIWKQFRCHVQITEVSRKRGEQKITINGKREAGNENRFFLLRQWQQLDIQNGLDTSIRKFNQK